MPCGPDEILTVVIGEEWRPTQATIDQFVSAYGGGWLEQAALRSTMALGVQTFGLLCLGPRVIGLMLVGMELFKLGRLPAVGKLGSRPLAQTTGSRAGSSFRLLKPEGLSRFPRAIRT